jgi:catechol 2,3-dioxygenase-like lactoylglutathione lyase family enzyme
MLSGLHHVAIVSQDVDRLIEFYVSVFEASVKVDIAEPRARHVLLDIGRDAALHVFEMPSSSQSVGTSEIFERGHLDHLALNVADEETFQLLRRRLVERGACDGTVTDFGPVKTCFFRDPDGMDCEIAMWADGPPRTFEERILEPFPTDADR